MTTAEAAKTIARTLNDQDALNLASMKARNPSVSYNMRAVGGLLGASRMLGSLKRVRFENKYKDVPERDKAALYLEEIVGDFELKAAEDTERLHKVRQAATARQFDVLQALPKFGVATYANTKETDPELAERAIRGWAYVLEALDGDPTFCEARKELDGLVERADHTPKIGIATATAKNEASTDELPPSSPLPARTGPATFEDPAHHREDDLRVQHVRGTWLGALEIKWLLDVGLSLLGVRVEGLDGYREATDQAKAGLVWHDLLFHGKDLSKRAELRATLDRIVNPHLAFLDDWYDKCARRNYADELPGADGEPGEEIKQLMFESRMEQLNRTIDKGGEQRMVDTSPFHNAYTNLVCDRSKPTVEPPKLQRSWTCMTAFWEHAFTSNLRPWAVQQFEKAARMCREHVVVGGVGKSARAALKKRLDFYSYAKDSDRHAVWLFCDRHEAWDGTVFDASLPKETKDMAAFGGTNIRPVRLCDPTRGEGAWGEEELGTFYAVVDAVIRAIVSDKRVFVVCVAGENRSVAVKHAIAPCAYPRVEPGCDAMLRAAEGYRNNHDMSLVPLAPKRGKRKHGP